MIILRNFSGLGKCYEVSLVELLYVSVPLYAASGWTVTHFSARYTVPNIVY
jgi:hypothetical protein